MVGLMLGVCSLMGLPWFVAATVLSITHVNSLKLESECSAPGEQPKFLGIREQRITGLMIFTLMGSSVFMTSVLQVRLMVFSRLSYLVTTRVKPDEHSLYNSKFYLLTLMLVCGSVHSHAGAVWSLPVHGGVISQRHSGKIYYISHLLFPHKLANKEMYIPHSDFRHQVLFLNFC